ncbi:hypothetical protein [Novosphingobium sp. PP1Y]|uniref:hypothetical protein n=1 Tax=Novosphingobium sp. PP1Y TaxID=702113 RepID=UPI00059F3025|nr:hypothetical protein [Novosphingobium sp. PP1Y]
MKADLPDTMFNLQAHNSPASPNTIARYRNTEAAFAITRASQPLPASDLPNLQWAYKPDSEGPSIEVAALGAGRKGTPRLAHLALGWDF